MSTSQGFTAEDILAGLYKLASIGAAREFDLDLAKLEELSGRALTPVTLMLLAEIGATNEDEREFVRVCNSVLVDGDDSNLTERGAPMKGNAQVNTKGLSMETIKKQAQEGVAESQYQFGLMSLYGEHVQQSYEEAYKWGLLAAKQQHAAAQAMVGYHLFNGNGVPMDKDKAVEYYMLSAEQGYPPAQQTVGRFYINGTVVAQDIQKGVELIESAANQQYLDAMIELGGIYLQGEIVPCDAQKAFYWYKLAADYGDADAQYAVAYCYLVGRGVSVDVNESDKYLNLSVEQGCEKASSFHEEMNEFVLVLGDLDDILTEPCPYGFQIRNKTMLKCLAQNEIFLDDILQDLNDFVELNPIVSFPYENVVCWFLKAVGHKSVVKSEQENSLN